MSKEKPFIKNKKFVWLNLAAMVVVLVAAILITFRWIDHYTQHGIAIQVPDVTRLQEADALQVLSHQTLRGITTDRTYVKGIPEGRVLEQRPAANAHVKKGRTVYLTVSSGNQPLVTVPDVADNSSLREAVARLRAAGFKLTDNDSVPGERDWVYGIRYQNEEVTRGAKLPEGASLTIVVGNGKKEPEGEKEEQNNVEEDWFN